ncbi:MAG: chorismate-binding protein [Muribaculaceae bacterium]|nr:chorismate-binding protein [Muribaculaceae bacterium]
MESQYPESFAAWRRPGEEWQYVEGLTFADGCLHGDGVCIAPWNHTIGVPDDDAFGHAVEQVSTPRSEYLESVAAVAARAAARGGKTVIARCICGEFKSAPGKELIESYFKPFGCAFCFIFRHPDTGWWMGASPELVAVERPEGGVLTRALAGTRAAHTEAPWDYKNLEEHRWVVEDICTRAAAARAKAGDAGLSRRDRAEAGGGTSIEGAVEIEPLEPRALIYRNIEHLCTPIVVHGIDVNTLASAIYPTPAVAGFPLSDAIEDINTFESRPRRFYAGLFSTPGTVYAMLRCVNFDSRHWCVYSGSGITPLSNPAEEWAETEAKALPLVSILNQY